MKLRTFFAIAAVATLTLAGALYHHAYHAVRAPPPPSGQPGLVPGDERRYALRLAVDLSRPGRPEPVEVVITGVLSVAVSEARAGEYDLAFEVLQPQVGGSGVPAAQPAELEGLRKRLARVFWATYRDDGTALRVHFPRDVEPADRNLLQILVTDAQFVRFKEAQAHWTALERDAAGTYLATYDQAAPALVLKRKLKYVELDGATGATAPGAMTVDVIASERRFTLDAAGAVTSVDGSDSSRIPLPMTEGQSLGVKIALRLTDMKPGRAPDRAGSLQRAGSAIESGPIRTHRPDPAAAQDSRDDRLLEGSTAAQLLSAAARPTQADALLPRRLEALFRRQPAAVTPALALIRQHGGQRLVSDALGAAGTPPAVDALLSLASDRAVSPPVRVDALIALYQLKAPEPQALTRTQALLDDPDRTVRRAARLALGALARAARTGEPSASAAADDELARRCTDAASLEERLDLFGALGNSAGPASARVLKAGLRGSDARLRAEAARDLRSAEDPEVDGLLVLALRTDPDARVRTAALFAAGYREPGPFLDALTAAATTDRADEVRIGAVALLRKDQTLYPQAGEALQKVAASDPKASVRKLAGDALEEVQRKTTTSASAAPIQPK